MRVKSWNTSQIMQQNGRISAVRPPIKKIKALCFLQLSKLEKTKCLYFFCKWPNGRDMGIFWYSPKIPFPASDPKKHKTPQ